jgi:hypothetical protein
MIKVSEIPDEGIVFYDIETTSQFAPYCKLKMLAYQLGMEGKPTLVDLESKTERARFAKLVGNPDILKVSYNGINFDDIVLWRHGMWVNPINRHDMYLALKTCHPSFPSYSLKAVNLLLDMQQSIEAAWHEPEWVLHDKLNYQKLDLKYMYTVTDEGVLEEYCKHDVRQTCNVFRVLWEIVQQPLHWRVYNKLELAMGEPLHEMILLGREYIDLDQIRREIVKHEKKREEWIAEANRRTHGEIPNIGSNKQLTGYLKENFKLEFAISEAGNYLLRKSDKLNVIEDINVDPETLTLDEWLIYASYQVFDLTKVIAYFRGYLRAGEFEQRRISANRKRGLGQVHSGAPTERIKQGGNSSSGDGQTPNSQVSIPKGYYLSGARTRRFQSSSKFHINFQNQNKRSKIVQLVPSGWLGFWLDSTQIENVAHIWASDDLDRKRAYIEDSNWNEYVWLCNRILGKEQSKEDLDSVHSRVNPAWSIYKQYKTIKLALNFGMGPDKFAGSVGLDRKKARMLFEQVHAACPAIRKLQRIVRDTIARDGFIKDPFGHIYSGDLNDAYKLVAYLIQGCGTGSIPKAMTVANFKTLHEMDCPFPMYYPYIFHPHKKIYSFGVLTGTTHDECAGRISLGLPNDRIVYLLRNLLYNMEERFSKLFDMPLRAKLYVSLTNAAEVEEIDHQEIGSFEDKLITVINHGKKTYEKRKRLARAARAGS